MSELETALNLYTETQSHANINLDDVPYRFRPGKESQKRQAQANLDSVKRSYQNALQKATFGVLVLGPGQADFVKIASEEAEVIVVDGSALYKRIACIVGPAIGSTHEFGVSHYGMVIQELRQIATELEVVSMPSPKWTEPASISSPQELLTHVRNMVDSSAGVDLLAYYVGQQITDEGLKAKASKNTVPVIITGLSTEMSNALGLRLFTEGRQIVVNTTEEVTKDFVLNTFKQIKQQLKQTKKN